MFSRIRHRRPFAAAAGLVAVAIAVTACSTSNVLSLRPDVDVGTETAAIRVVPVAAGIRPMDAPDETYNIGYSVPEDPSGGDVYADQPDQAFSTPPAVSGVLPPPVEEDISPSGPMPVDPEPSFREPYVQQPAVMPADEVACRGKLKRLGVIYEDLDRIGDGGTCGIAYPVKLQAIGSVKMQPAATLRCEMALAVATWTKKELVPSARSRYLSGVKAIHQASSYSCRKIARSRTMSEHSKGNALDISRIELNNGRDIEVEKPGLFAFRTRSLLKNVRADACEYFSTVLGPGYDYDHRNHFHFDIKPRRRTACH